MRLLLKRYADGRLRPFWYGIFQRAGRKQVRTLCRIAGNPPASLKLNDTGDTAFEHSRQKALIELAEMAEGRQSEADKEKLFQQIHVARYGTKIEPVQLADLADRWEKFPGKRRRGALQIEICRGIIGRFQQHMATEAPKMQELGEVKADHVRSFMDAEQARGITGRTWNRSLGLLKACFKRLEPYGDAWRNYLKEQVKEDENSVHREPFTPEEITAVVDAAAADPELKPLIITALCTAMRRGDVCRLRWKNVDLKQGFITVKTSKSNELVEIPILPMLRVELERIQADHPPLPGDYVFPAAAALYANNPDQLNDRLQVILERAGFVDDEKLKRLKAEQAKRATLVQLAPDDLRRRGLQALAAAAMSAKRRERTREIFTRYMDGASVKQIAKAMPSSAGLVSLRLADVERLTGAAVVRRPALPEVHRGTITADIPSESHRCRRACLKGWHSFRTTWITLALSAGVPEMIVRRVTGHATADVVLKHYFRPGREQFRAALAGALPKALTAGGVPDKDAEAVKIIRKMTSRTLVRDKARLLALLAPQNAHR
jgi:integrase